MPQKNAPCEEETVCQECLEREMGNWFEEDINPELVKMVNDSLGYLTGHGICGVCGRKIFMPYQFQPKLQFDCLSEELEIEDFREELLEEQVFMLN